MIAGFIGFTAFSFHSGFSDLGQAPQGICIHSPGLGRGAVNGQIAATFRCGVIHRAIHRDQLAKPAWHGVGSGTSAGLILGVVSGMICRAIVDAKPEEQPAAPDASPPVES